MDDLAFLFGLGLCIAFWLLLSKSMKINGMAWWWRHLSAALWSPLAMLGGLMLAGGLLGASDSEGEPFGIWGVVSGIATLSPLILPLGISWRAAKRNQLNIPTADNEQQATTTPQPNKKADTKPNPVPETKPAPDPSLEPEPKQYPAPGLASELPPAPESKLEPGAKTTQVTSEKSPVSPTATGNVRFIYRDAEGNKSTRELINFKLNNGKVRGFCLDSEAIRTFRLDRIVSFIEGESQLYGTEAIAAKRAESPDNVRSGDPEITFSGFDAKTRASLEKTAKAHGFVVRKSVTKNLDYFVAGQRRSGSKLAEAEDKPGCSVIDKEGFLWLLATGETSN